MIRFAVSFPERLTAEQTHRLREVLDSAMRGPQARTLILDSGGTIQEFAPTRPSAAFLSRARSRVR